MEGVLLNMYGTYMLSRIGTYIGARYTKKETKLPNMPKAKSQGLAKLKRAISATLTSSLD